MLSINGVAVATPSSFKVVISDIDGETERNANGDLIRDRISVKRKLECEWPAMTNAEISTLLQSVSSVFFQVTYPDPMTGSNLTKTMYVGDRTAPMYKQGLWEGLSMSFIER